MFRTESNTIEFNLTVMYASRKTTVLWKNKYLIEMNSNSYSL